MVRRKSGLTTGLVKSVLKDQLDLDCAFLPDDQAISGLTFATDPFVVVFVDTQYGEDAARFTLAHEGGHLAAEYLPLLERGELAGAKLFRLDPLENLTASKGSPRREVVANSCAEALLAPKAMTRRMPAPSTCDAARPTCHRCTDVKCGLTFVHGPRTTNWDALYRVAAAQGGYFTVQQAQQVGYSRPLLHHHVTHRRMERWGRGVLRLVHFPATEHEDLVPLWLWSDRTCVFSHETALMLHTLFDAHPGKRHMILPKSWERRRLRLPKGVVVTFADVPDEDRVWIGPIPVTTPLLTLADCARGHVQPDLLRDAIRGGAARQLFKATEARAQVRRSRAPEE